MRWSWSLASRWALTFALALIVALGPRVAAADVRLEGDWNGQDRPVTVDANATSRAHAIELLAAAAGWSVVLSTPLPDVVDVHVKDQPASKVLTLLLPDGDFVARRSGDLVSIRLSTSPPGPTPSAPSPVAMTAGSRGDDWTVFGGNLIVQEADVVHDVTIFGGNLDVYGTVTGDSSVFGGAARVHDKAKVLGSASVVGGEMHIDEGATVEHDVGVVGGHVDRAGRTEGSGEKEDQAMTRLERGRAG